MKFNDFFSNNFEDNNKSENRLFHTKEFVY